MFKKVKQHKQEFFYPAVGCDDNAFFRVFRTARTCGMVERLDIKKMDGGMEVAQVTLRDGFQAVAFTVVIAEDLDTDNGRVEKLATNLYVLSNGNGLWHSLFEAAAVRW